MADDLRKPCCQQPDNLTLVSTQTTEGGEETCHRCVVCGCRHFGVTLDPGALRAKGGTV